VWSTQLAAQQAAVDSEAIQKADLVTKLANPFRNLTTVPLETNLSYGPGPEHMPSYLLNFQPIVPFSLNRDWLLITRTILPVTDQPVSGGNRKFGLGDTEVTLFLSPKSFAEGLMWAAGPLVLLPTATATELGRQKWGAGPAAVLGYQEGGWTTALLADQTWSFAGSGSENINETLIDPWLTYSWSNGLTVKAETEAVHDWTSAEWTVPLELGLSELLTIAKQPVSVGWDLIYYAERTVTDPRWGLRFTLTFALSR
jgi:hypothetical protein